jgi:hypothetical protein
MLEMLPIHAQLSDSNLGRNRWLQVGEPLRKWARAIFKQEFAN